MRKIHIIVVLSVVLIGLVCVNVYSISEINKPVNVEKSEPVVKIITEDYDVPSPYDWIKESQIKVYNNRVIINIDDAEWASFTDTGSMDPVFDYGANVIQIIPSNIEDIHIGDIISYKSDITGDIIIHRVKEINFDENGWYIKAKGDNNQVEDPERIRFNQIDRIVVAVIY